jgi:predicted nucleic-acid-binding protein
MIALDTNVLLRCITLDDASQLSTAQQLLGHPDGVFIAKSVLLEVEWALRDVFNLPKAAVLKSLNTLCGLAHVHLENEEQVAQALQDHARGMDFADALHAASSQADEGLYTFDKKFVKKAITLGREVHLAKADLAGLSH